MFYMCCRSLLLDTWLDSSAPNAFTTTTVITPCPSLHN